MTVAIETTKQQANGDGATTVFGFPSGWDVKNKAHLRVIKDTGVVRTILTEGVDYTVSLTSSQITMTVAPAIGTTITIRLYPPLKQEGDLRNRAEINLGAHEDLHDARQRQILRHEDDLSRAIRLPESEVGSLAKTELARAVGRALKFFSFDASGNPTVANGVTGVPDSAVTLTVDTVAELKALALPASALVYLVRGYSAIGDGGGGLFVWSAASSASDDGGTIFQRAAGGAGRWVRLYDAALSVKWFGATGDGVTSDAAAIQAAINVAAAFTYGKDVYAPRGEYKLGATALTCTNRFVNIIGAGKDSTKFTYTGTGVALTIGTTAGAGADTSGSVRHLTITGSASATSGLRIIALNGYVLDNIRIEDCTGGNGLLLDGANCVQGFNVDTQNNLVGVKFVTDATTPGGPYAANLNTFIGGQIKNNAQHVVSTDSADGNKFYGTYLAVASVEPNVSLQKAVGWRFDSCMWESNTAGANSRSVELGAAGAGTDCNGCMFVNCYFTEENAFQDHIRVTRGSRNTFVGNVHSGPFTRACVRFETNAAACLVQWAYNASSGGAAVISDASGTVDHASMGPGTTFYRSAVGWVLDYLTGSGANFPSRLRSPAAGTDSAQFADAAGNITGNVPEVPGITEGSGTGLTVNKTASLNRFTHKVTITYAALAAAATTADKTIAVLPAKTRIVGAYADVTTVFSGGAVATCQMILGKSVGGAEYLSTFDCKTATIQRGMADADMGTALTRAARIQDADLPSWTAPTNVSCRITTTGANTDALTQGSVTFYLICEKLP
jgi:hypothetical protein